MAEKIANLIAAYTTYLAINRALRNDIVKAANSIGYPGDDLFMTHMSDLKSNDRYIYEEMGRISGSFDALADKAEQLLEEICSGKCEDGGDLQPLDVDKMDEIREGVKKEVEGILEAKLARFEGKEKGTEVKRDAVEGNTEGNAAGKTYKRKRSQRRRN